MANQFLENKEHQIQFLIISTDNILSGTDSYDVFVFRKLIEAALKLGYWNGTVGMS